MYARVVSGSIPPDKIDEAVHLWQESVAPTAKQQHGFKKARLFVERKIGKVTSMGLWETEADVLASAQWNQDQVAKFARLFAAPPNIELYELAAEV